MYTDPKESSSSFRSQPQQRLSPQPKSNLQPTDPLTFELDERDLGVAFPALMRGLTTKCDVRSLVQICRRIMGTETELYNPLLAAFYEEVVEARSQFSPQVLAMERILPEDWHKSPWYVASVQCLGVEHNRTDGTFDSLRRMIPYIRHNLGFKNVLLLPHYESPMADGGYDVSDYTVRSSLGGTKAFKRFMEDAQSAGLRVATDAVFNHTSTRHEWFQQAISGDERFQRYYLQRNGREKIDEWEIEGEVWCKYRDIDGCISKRAVSFPDVDRTHGLWVEINHQTHQFYRTFYPFQVDLNLQNVDVLRELMRVLARDVSDGVLGKRMDSVVHWIKKPGVAHGEESDECHALLALFKQFLRHIHRRSVVLPHLLRSMKQSSNYGGSPTCIRGSWSASEGDGIFSFEMQAALREAIYLQTIVPFWRRAFATDCLRNDFSVWLNFIEHHDAIYLGFHPRPVRRWIADYITSHNGVLSTNGMLGAGRLGDALRSNEQRLIAAFALLYLAPGTPMLYSGCEISALSHWDHAREWTSQREKLFNDLGVYVDKSAIFDLRELHRGPLLYQQFDQAVEDGIKPISFIKKLNSLLDVFPDWPSAQLSPVMSGDDAVIAAVKHCEASSLLCVINLSYLRKSIKLPADQVEHVLGLDQWAPVGKSDFRKHESSGSVATNKKKRSFLNLVGEESVSVECDVTAAYISVDAFHCSVIRFRRDEKRRQSEEQFQSAK